MKNTNTDSNIKETLKAIDNSRMTTARYIYPMFSEMDVLALIVSTDRYRHNFTGRAVWEIPSSETIKMLSWVLRCLQFIGRKAVFLNSLERVTSSLVSALNWKPTVRMKQFRTGLSWKALTSWHHSSRGCSELWVMQLVFSYTINFMLLFNW